MAPRSPVRPARRNGNKGVFQNQAPAPSYARQCVTGWMENRARYLTDIKKAPPFADGAFQIPTGQWQPTPQAFPMTFLALSKCRCNADDGLPTVCVDFPLVKNSTVPGAHFARKGFPSARLLQHELRENHTSEPQHIMRRPGP
jgi:hypothetical protein